MMHLSDDFAMQSPQPRTTTAKPMDDDPIEEHLNATDATNMAMYEQGTIQPEDI